MIRNKHFLIAPSLRKIMIYYYTNDEGCFKLCYVFQTIILIARDESEIDEKKVEFEGIKTYKLRVLNMAKKSKHQKIIRKFEIRNILGVEK